MAWVFLSGAWRQGAGTVSASGSKIKKTLLSRARMRKSDAADPSEAPHAGRGERPREEIPKPESAKQFTGPINPQAK